MSKHKRLKKNTNGRQGISNNLPVATPCSSKTKDEELMEVIKETYSDEISDMALRMKSVLDSRFQDKSEIIINRNVFEELVSQTLEGYFSEDEKLRYFIEAKHLSEKCRVLQTEQIRLNRLRYSLKKQVEDAKHIIKKLIDEQQLLNRGQLQRRLNQVPLKRVVRSVGMQVCTVGPMTFGNKPIFEGDRSAVNEIFNAKVSNVMELLSKELVVKSNLDESFPTSSNLSSMVRSVSSPSLSQKSDSMEVDNSSATGGKSDLAKVNSSGMKGKVNIVKYKSDPKGEPCVKEVRSLVLRGKSNSVKGGCSPVIKGKLSLVRAVSSPALKGKSGSGKDVSSPTTRGKSNLVKEASPVVRGKANESSPSSRGSSQLLKEDSSPVLRRKGNVLRPSSSPVVRGKEENSPFTRGKSNLVKEVSSPVTRGKSNLLKEVSSPVLRGKSNLLKEESSQCLRDMSNSGKEETSLCMRRKSKSSKERSSQSIKGKSNSVKEGSTTIPTKGNTNSGKQDCLPVTKGKSNSVKEEITHLTKGKSNFSKEESIPVTSGKCNSKNKERSSAVKEKKKLNEESLSALKGKASITKEKSAPFTRGKSNLIKEGNSLVSSDKPNFLKEECSSTIRGKSKLVNHENIVLAKGKTNFVKQDSTLSKNEKSNLIEEDSSPVSGGKSNILKEKCSSTIRDKSSLVNEQTSSALKRKSIVKEESPLPTRRKSTLVKEDSSSVKNERSNMTKEECLSGVMRKKNSKKEESLSAIQVKPIINKEGIIEYKKEDVKFKIKEEIIEELIIEDEVVYVPDSDEEIMEEESFCPANKKEEILNIKEEVVDLEYDEDFIVEESTHSKMAIQEKINLETTGESSSGKTGMSQGLGPFIKIRSPEYINKHFSKEVQNAGPKRSLETGLTSFSNLPKYPESPKYPLNIAKPPAPILQVGRNDVCGKLGIMLTWSFTCNKKPENIEEYELFAYQEGKSGEKNENDVWKKVGDIKALPLPMACFLSQFVEGKTYYFIIRAVDKQKIIGDFSIPQGIFLQKPDPSATPSQNIFKFKPF